MGPFRSVAAAAFNWYRQVPLMVSPTLFVGTYLAAIAVSVVLVFGLLDQRASATLVLVVVALALVITASVVPGFKSRRGAIRVWTAIWIAIPTVALLNQAAGWVSIQRYGDWRFFAAYVVEGRVVHRWLAGSAILNKVHAVILGSGLIPTGEDGAGLFLRCASILAMAAASLLLLRRWPRRLQVILPCLTPVWLLFALGYAEYYPFVAGLWVFTLAWVMERPLAERSSVQVGLLAGLLFPLAYIGFAPQAAVLVLAYALASPRKILAMLAWAAATSLIGVSLFWPQGLIGYFNSILVALTRRSGGHLIFPAYRGQTAAEDSILFSWDYVFSPGHLWDLLLMKSMLGGPLLAGVALAGGALILTRAGRPAWRGLAEPRSLFLMAACLWQAYYFLRMVPVLGPVKDIDVFFATTLTLAFVAGLLVDRLIQTAPGWRRWVVPIAIAVCLGSFASAMPSLIFSRVQLPSPRWSAEKYAAALKHEMTPELVRSLNRAIGTGQVRLSRIPGFAAAGVAAVTRDRWTKGESAGILSIENPTESSLTPLLELACLPSREHLPVRVSLVDSLGNSRDHVFDEPGVEVVALDPLEPGQNRLLVVWADRGWPGRERRPRTLGVRLKSVTLQFGTEAEDREDSR